MFFMKSETVRLFKKSWKFIIPFWKSEETYKAIGMLALIVLLVLCNIALSVRLAYWSKDFYNALENKSYVDFIYQIKVFLVLLSILIPVVLTHIVLTGFLTFRWREWMTNKFLKNWTENDTYYHVMLHVDKVDNPDQRISQDISVLCTQTIGLFLSFLREIVTLFSFAFVLWTVSSSIPLKIFGHSFNIQGYLVWVAFIYSVFGTGIIIKIGKPLIQLDFMQEHYEANFRYSLIRLQEKREEVALFQGTQPEIKNLHDAFDFIRKNYYDLIKRNAYITLSLSCFGNLSQLIPIIAAAPMYFAGIVTLGVVMQVLSSFEKVRDSFSVIANNFTTIASWRAATKRLLQLVQHMELADQDVADSHIKFSNNNNNIKFTNLSLKKPNSRPMLKGINFSVGEHERILLMGNSGVGKSTIVRAMKGLWTYGSGKIEQPGNVFYVPQRPYMPVATLHDSLIYPILPSKYKSEDSQLIELLDLFKLSHLTEHLGERKDWSTTLSLGEQQRISFIRILLNKPKWVVMDEPTSSLNKDLEEMLFNTLLSRIKDITMLTVGHSETLKKHHKKVIDVEKWSVL
jgi:vitamin B12/bleomycin/antimicrobial peptide transport system ATP-binding/permease protein